MEFTVSSCSWKPLYTLSDELLYKVLYVSTGSDDAFESLTKRIKKQKILSLRRLRLSLGPKPNSKKRLKWTESEEREFLKAVRQHGAGNWALIRSHLCTHRSTIQLKDKWRNICNKNGTP